MRMLCIIFSTVGWAWAAIVLAYIAGFHYRNRQMRAARGFSPIVKNPRDHT